MQYVVLIKKYCKSDLLHSESMMKKIKMSEFTDKNLAIIRRS